jgi:hypothetical protein
MFFKNKFLHVFFYTLSPICVSIFFIIVGFLCFLKTGGILAFFYLIAGEVPILLICLIRITANVSEANEIYELNINTPYTITFERNRECKDTREKLYAYIHHREKPWGYQIKNEESLYTWKKNFYNEQAILYLCCVREYIEEGLFSKDYLPLDMFKQIVKSL